MYMVGVTTKTGKIFAKNFNTKQEAENWILEQANIKKAIIVNKDNIKEREIINF